MSLRTPVITGTGIVCAAGLGVREVWEALRAGRSGLGPLTLFSSTRYGAHLVGQVRLDVDKLAGSVRGSRSDKLAWLAAREAWQSAGLKSGTATVPPERFGVFLGSTVGGMLGTESFLKDLMQGRRPRFGALRFHDCAGAADLCARLLGARGPCATVSTACSAGAMAIAAAAEMIGQGEADVMLAGGGDSLCRLTLNGFGSLLLLDPKGCRPFDARRTGISLGEGAGMLILEAEETARARGARILARLTGWGASCDAWHATAPHPEGRGAFFAMRQALQSAGLPPAAIDFVCAHGTATPDNDAVEIKALKRLFPDRLPPIASLKRFFGHTLAASGPIKAAVCVAALQEQQIPPNLGFEQPDPALDFEPVKKFTPRPLSHILSNSFGFGGNNVALVFSRAPVGSVPIPNRRCIADFQVGRPSESSQTAGLETRDTADLEVCATASAPAPAQRPSSRLAIVGAGVVSPAGRTPAEFFATFARGGAPISLFEVPAARSQARVYAVGEFGAGQLIEAAKRRRLSRLQQMALVAAQQSLPPAATAAIPPERICVALGTGLGSLNDTAAFVENMLLKDERAPRPAFFTNSVHNSLASMAALELKLTGLNSTPVQHDISFETALWQGANEIARGRADLALAGAADELNQYALAAGLHWGWWDGQSTPMTPFSGTGSRRAHPLPGEGCALFTLAAPGHAAASKPLAWVSACSIGRASMSAGGRIDALAEARWIQAVLQRDGGSLAEGGLLLTGANGWAPLDRAYLAVAEALSKLAGRQIPCAAYKHCCGELHSASAFGLLAAIGLARGEISPANCHCQSPSADRMPTLPLVLLYTLSLGGSKALCCVRA